MARTPAGSSVQPLVAINGMLPNGGEIETICLEEEAAQRIKDETFSLDRLGIPLIEITTSPCMHTSGRSPVGRRIYRHGAAFYRQSETWDRHDTPGCKHLDCRGSPVEIKGVQELDLIAEVVRREIQPQPISLGYVTNLSVGNAGVDRPGMKNVTGLFASTKSAVLKKAKHGQPDRRLKDGELVMVSFPRSGWPEEDQFEGWILHEDKEILVLLKPARLLMHPMGTSWLSAPEAASMDNDINLAGILFASDPKF